MADDDDVLIPMRRGCEEEEEESGGVTLADAEDAEVGRGNAIGIVGLGKCERLLVLLLMSIMEESGVN